MARAPLTPIATQRNVELGVEVVTNLPDFQFQLKQFADKLQKQIVNRALGAAARVFKEAVIKSAPIEKKYHKGHEPGTLRRAIYAYRQRGVKPGTVEIKVSFRKGKGEADKKRDAYFGRFLEKGWIPALEHKRQQGGRKGRAEHRARNAHRRIAYPFLKPVFTRNAARQAALQAFFKVMQREIDKEVKKKSAPPSEAA